MTPVVEASDEMNVESEWRHYSLLALPDQRSLTFPWLCSLQLDILVLCLWSSALASSRRLLTLEPVQTIFSGIYHCCTLHRTLLTSIKYHYCCPGRVIEFDLTLQIKLFTGYPQFLPGSVWDSINFFGSLACWILFEGSPTAFGNNVLKMKIS